MTIYISDSGPSSQPSTYRPRKLPRTGNFFHMPDFIEPGPVREKLDAWLARYKALPNDLRAPIPAWDELIAMQTVTEIRDASQNETLANLKENLELQVSLPLLIKEVEELLTPKRMHLMNARVAASEALISVIGQPNGSIRPTTPLLADIDRQLEEISRFTSSRVFHDSRRGTLIEEARQLLHDFIEQEVAS